MPRTLLELAEDELACDGDTVTPIKRNSADVEYTRDSSHGTKTNQVDDNTPENRDPDCEEGSAGLGADFRPDVGEGQETVTGEGKDGSAESLHGGEAYKLDDDEAEDSERDAAAAAE